MSHPSEDYEAPLHPFGKESHGHKHDKLKHTIGIALFEKTFNFYAWYLSYDSNPSKHHHVFELLSILMQIAKISFEGASILSLEEEHRTLKELHELSDSLSNGKIKNQDLSKSLDKIITGLINNNAKAKLITLLMKLEYRVCIHNEEEFSESLQKKFKELLSTALEHIDSNLPNLIANTVARDLEALHKTTLHADTFLKKFNDTVTLLKHVY